MESEKDSPLLAIHFILLQAQTVAQDTVAQDSSAPSSGNSLVDLFSQDFLFIVLGVLGVVLLLICSALISGSEVAFFSLSPGDFEKLQNDNDPASDKILQLKEEPEKLLATILISNNFINIAIVILSEFVLRLILPDKLTASWSIGITNALELIGIDFNPISVGRIVSFLITVVGVTFLLVLFGEVAPKFYARFNNIALSKFMAGPLTVLMKVFTPFSRILVGWTDKLETQLAHTTKNSGLTSREDIDEAIELTAINDAEIEQEADILKSIVKFGDVSAKQIMKSRIDVVAVDFRINYEELLAVVKKSGYSRIPVYDEDFDNVTGLLYAKDLLGHLKEPLNFEWQELIRTNVLFIPESKKIDDLLKEFQQKRLHMAIVVDEYGGSSGIVTLEDIMEEIIGEIQDEFDDEAELIHRKLDDQNYIFEGKVLLNDFCRIIGVDTSTFDEVRGESDSLAGLILELHGSLPEKDSEIKYDNYKFKIVEVDNRRIHQVLVSLEFPKEESNDT